MQIARESGLLVERAQADLVLRLGIDLTEIDVAGVEEAQFPDPSLGVPEPEAAYTQVITPGYVIKLAAGHRVCTYHASDGRAVHVPQETKTPPGSLSIEGVRVIAGERIVVRGWSALPDGTCLESELRAGGESQAWWSGDTCVAVENGT